MPRFFRNRTPSRSRRRTAPLVRFFKPHCEELENRTLLSAGHLTAGALLHALPQRGHSGYVSYSPSQILSAYGFDNSVNVSGTSTNVNLTGAGQTLAIVDAFDDPNIVADLQTFDQLFSGSGLDNFSSYLVEGTAVGIQPGGGGPVFSKVAVAPGSASSTGAYSSTLPSPDSGWSLEIALDVEWAHAIAPGANIQLVEAASDSNSDLLAAVGYAKQQPGVSVVSMSWGEGEFAGEVSYDSTFTAPGVTFVAASGDSGGWAGPSWPAISPNVMAVGGTQLTINSTGTTETAWSGSGGGVSAYETKPAYQNTGDVQTSARANPDIAYNASSSTAYSVYDTYGQSGPVSVYGTSAGAPQWSGLVARANQALSLQGQPALANAQAALYALPASSFNDVTSGSNGPFTATTGFDLVTGLGSPKANLVISGLIGASSSAMSATTTGSTSTSSSSTSSGQTHHSRGLFGDNADSAGFQAPVTLGQTTGTQNAAAVPVVVAGAGSRSLTTLLAGQNQDNKFNLIPTGSHLQSDATDSGGGGAVQAADPGPVPANDNNNDNEDS